MDDILTTAQVISLLKVDRITVYRMLQDGRIKGIKIGQQWRFQASEVNRLLERETAAPAAKPEALDAAVLRGEQPGTSQPGPFPQHCVQVIQNMYSGLGKICAVTVDKDGKTVTQTSQPCQFCTLIQSSPSAREACRKSRRDSTRKGTKGGWFTCHAGVRYHQAPIYDNSLPVAYLLSGHHYPGLPDKAAETEQLKKLAEKHGLDWHKLQEAANQTPAVDADRLAEIDAWPQKFTDAIESILKERARLVNKLQQIAEISAN
jgi:excisionase family DNA binding protein